jgi:hypothetical protein
MFLLSSNTLRETLAISRVQQWLAMRRPIALGFDQHFRWPWQLVSLWYKGRLTGLKCVDRMYRTWQATGPFLCQRCTVFAPTSEGHFCLLFSWMLSCTSYLSVRFYSLRPDLVVPTILLKWFSSGVFLSFLCRGFIYFYTLAMPA